MNKTIRLRLALLACFLAAPAVAVEVGWIDSIDGSVPGVKLVRQGKAESAKPYSPVQTDDVIQLPDEKTSGGWGALRAVENCNRGRANCNKR